LGMKQDIVYGGWFCAEKSRIDKASLILLNLSSRCRCFIP
jgi:hypothetical protein